MALFLQPLLCVLSIVSGVVVERSIPSVDGTPNVYNFIPGFVPREVSAVVKVLE